MALTYRGLRKASGGLASDGYRRTYTRMYRFLSNDLANDAEPAVIAAVTGQGITPYSPHPYDSKALVTDIQVDLVSRVTLNGGVKGALWNATVQYGPVSPLEQQAGGNPTTQPIRYRLDPETTEEPVFVDYNNVPIVNSASDYFDPPVTDEVTRYQLTIMRNEVSVSIPTLMAISSRRRVNNAPWNGFPTGTVKLLPLRLPEREWSAESNTLYYPMEYVFLIDFDGWKVKLLDQGLRRTATVSGSTKQVAILDAGGQPITTPALLKNGQPITLPASTSSVSVLSFDVCAPFDFSVLNLDGALS